MKKSVERSFDTNRGRRQGPVAARINVSCHISAICFVSGENVKNFWKSKKGLRLNFWIGCVDGVD